MELRLHLPDLTEQLRRAVAEEVERQRDALAGDRWMTTRETASYLNCSVGRLHNLNSEGRIPSHREGGRLMFSRSELDEWIRGGKAAA